MAMKNRKERKTAIMGHRKQLTFSAPSFLIISSEHPARDTAKQTALTDHLPSMSEPLLIIRPASLPVPLVEERGEMIRQASNADTPDNAKSSPSPSSHPTAGDRQSHGNRDRHGTPHIDAVPAAKQARRDTRHHRLPAPRSEQTRRSTGRDERHYPPHSRNGTGKQTTARRRTDETTRHTGRETDRRNETRQTGRAGERTHKSKRNRTRKDGNEHEASSREFPETAHPTSETAPETDTMEQIDRPRDTGKRGPHRPSKQPPDRRPDSPTSSASASPHASPPDTKNGETRKGGTERETERQASREAGRVRRDGERAESTRRRTIKHHGYEQRPAEDL